MILVVIVFLSLKAVLKLMVRNRHWRLISILIVLIDLKRDKTLNLVLFQIMRPAQSFKIRRNLAFDWPVLVLNGHKLCLSQMVTNYACLKWSRFVTVF